RAAPLHADSRRALLSQRHGQRIHDHVFRFFKLMTKNTLNTKEASKAPARILVVEDEAITAADLQERLIALGYAIAGWSVTGEKAIALAQIERPDLVLMDIMLKGRMNGIEA